MTHKTGGDVLAEALIAQGVDTIFGIPGVQLDAASDALYHRADVIDFICARNEQATTYMADGYARSTGREGVAMVVPGPGVLNALAGLATAYSANSPVLLIAGQIDSHAIGQGLGALHEIPDQTGMLERITKWTGTAMRAADIPDLVAEAFKQMRSGRPRPVALEVPPDVLAEVVEEVTISPFVERQPIRPENEAIDEVAQILDAAQHPLIVVGGGVVAAEAGEAVLALAEKINAPVLVTENGRGGVDARHPLVFDLLAIRELRERADAVLAIGSRFVTTFGTRMNTGRAKVVLVNAENHDLHGPREADIAVHSDAKIATTAILEALGERQRKDRSEELATTREWLNRKLDDIAPQREYLSVIRGALPQDGVFVSEFTQVGYAASACYPAYTSRTYIGPGYQGTLGYGFATALGVKAADPSRAVVSVNGDGGFSWTLQELSTMKRFGLGVVTIIFHDGFYGNVRRIQKGRYGERFFASDLTNPDYQTLAQAFGVTSLRVFSPEELARVLPEAIAANEPILIEVPVGEFPSPWHLIHEGIPTPSPLPEDSHLVSKEAWLSKS